MSNKIKLGILGGGNDSLIGVLHRIASYMYDQYELVGGVFSSNLEKSEAFADEIGINIGRIYPDLDTLIRKEATLSEEERMQVISILTPNFLHFPMAVKLMKNGYHIICEKPLTTTYAEAKKLQVLQEKTGKILAVTYTYTGYPMVRQMKAMIAQGRLGKIQKVDVQYYQGWINPIIHDPAKRTDTWRLNPEKAGISCCIGDIGTHAFQMVEYVTGLKIKEILADLNYLYEGNEMDIDGTVLLRFSEYVKGVIRSSQIATGEENNLSVSIYGEKAGLKWEQEDPNYLYLLQDGKPMQVFKPGNPYNSDFSLEGTKLPPGHPEGIFDAMGNIYHGIAQAIRGGKYHDGAFPTLKDGLRGMDFIEKVVSSHKNGNIWSKLQN